MAKIIELIHTVKYIGQGAEGDPYREVHQLFTKDGELVAEDNSHDDKSFFNSLPIVQTITQTDNLCLLESL